MSEDEMRTHIVGLRLSTEELKRLDDLAVHNGLSRVNALRMIVKKAHDVYAYGKSKRKSDLRDGGRKAKAG